MLLNSVHCTARPKTVRRKVCEIQEVTSCSTKNGKCIKELLLKNEEIQAKSPIPLFPSPALKKNFSWVFYLQELLLFSETPRPIKGWGWPNLLFNGYRWSFPEVEGQETDADPLSQSTANVNNQWIYTSIPLICLHAVHRDKFIFTSFIFCEPASYH